MEKSELPKLVIVGIALAGLGLLIVNAVLVAWFIIRRRNKGIFILSIIWTFLFVLFLFLRRPFMPNKYNSGLSSYSSLFPGDESLLFLRISSIIVSYLCRRVLNTQ